MNITLFRVHTSHPQREVYSRGAKHVCFSLATFLQLSGKKLGLNPEIAPEMLTEQVQA